MERLFQTAKKGTTSLSPRSSSLKTSPRPLSFGLAGNNIHKMSSTEHQPTLTNSTEPAVASYSTSSSASSETEKAHRRRSSPAASSSSGESKQGRGITDRIRGMFEKDEAMQTSEIQRPQEWMEGEFQFPDASRVGGPLLPEELAESYLRHDGQNWDRHVHDPDYYEQMDKLLEEQDALPDVNFGRGQFKGSLFKELSERDWEGNKVEPQQASNQSRSNSAGRDVSDSGMRQRFPSLFK